MEIAEFIQKRLNDLKSTEKSALTFTSEKELADYIFRTVMSKKFRKFSVIPEYIPHIRGAIENSIKNNLPIKFAIPFGAYKLWRLEESPEVDWAELFTLMYYAKWLKPITEVYKPGIWFDFSSDEVIVERLNNTPKSDTEAYAKSFNTVLNFLKKYLPENMKFTITPVRSLYTPQEFEKDLLHEITKMQDEQGLPKLDDTRKKMVEMNVKLKPDQDKDPLWREKTELLHQAYYNISRRRPYTRAKDKIFVWCNRAKDGKAVSVGTTKTSVAKFWVGVGALKKTNDGFIEYILSPSQLEKTKFNWELILIDGLSGKNFSKIRLLNK